MKSTQLFASICAASNAASMLLAPPAIAQGKGEAVKFQDYPGTTGNMLIRVDIAKGYSEKAGIKCSLQSIPSAPLGAQAMMSKSIDSFLGPAAVMNDAIQNGAKMKIVVGQGNLHELDADQGWHAA